MKTKSKAKRLFLIMAIVGIIFILSGGAIFAVTLANNDWNVFNLDNEELTATYFVDADRTFDRVEFDARFRFNIRMGTEFRVDYFNSNISTITTSVLRNDNGNYTFRFYESGHSWTTSFMLGFAGLARTQASVYITVTQKIFAHFDASSIRLNAVGVDFYGLVMDGSSSRLHLEDAVVSGDVIMDGSSVNAVFRNVDVGGRIVFDGSSQDIEGYRLTADEIFLDGSSIDLSLRNSVIDRLIVDGSSTKIYFRNSAIRVINVDGSSVRVDARRSHMHTFIVDGSSLRANLELYGITENVGAFNFRRADVSGVSGIGQRFKQFSINGSSARLNITMLGGESVFA